MNAIRIQAMNRLKTSAISLFRSRTDGFQLLLTWNPSSFGPHPFCGTMKGNRPQMHFALSVKFARNLSLNSNEMNDRAKVSPQRKNRRARLILISPRKNMYKNTHLRNASKDATFKRCLRVFYVLFHTVSELQSRGKIFHYNKARPEWQIRSEEKMAKKRKSTRSDFWFLYVKCKLNVCV